MPLIPLLPKPRVQDWPSQAEPGLHAVSDQDYQRNLCENYFDASSFGTPSPLAHAIVFRERLEQFLLDHQGENPTRRFDDAFRTWSLLLKGLYLGLIKLRAIDLGELKELGRIVERELPPGYPLSFLEFEGTVIGISFPEVGFAPSARLDAQTLGALREQVLHRDIDKASEYFVGWVHTYDQQDVGQIPYFSLLYRLAGDWNPEAPKTLPRAPEKLFGEAASLQVTGDAVALARVPTFIGTPIVCESCGSDISEQVGSLEVSHPDHFRCPNCQTQYDWLRDYSEWIRWDEERGQFLIYAFATSPLRHPPHSKVVSFERPDRVSIRTGKFTLEIRGLVLSEEHLKCNRLLFFKDGDSVREPDLPIRGEYFGLVKPYGDRRPVRDRVSGAYVARLKVTGWEEPVTITYGKDEIQEEEALLLTWPNFQLEGWNAYFYLLEPTPQMNRAGIRVRALERGAAPALLGGSRGRIEKPFEALEVVFAPEGGALKAQAGIYIVERTPLERGESLLTLALDFGTSNSSIWYRLGDGRSRVLRFRDHTNTLIPNNTIAERCIDLSYWLPTYRLDDPDTARRFYRAQLDTDDGLPSDAETIVRQLDYFLPSELIVWPPLSPENLAEPISGFRLCHALAARPHGRVIYELKTVDVEGNMEGRFTYEQGVSRYLESFLVLALATIASTEERAGHLKVRASFPRAFSPEKLQAYHACLERVLKTVENLTGFTTNALRYIDESRAAAFSMRTAEGLSLVMDMGGGTTDIGIFRTIRGKLEPLMVESMLYGGNAFLRLLARESEADLFPKPSVPRGERVDEEGVSEERLLWLLRETRMRGFKTVVSSQYRGNNHSREVMLDLLLRFMAPLAYTVRRMFEALALREGRDPKELLHGNLTYYLVGNGWTLADAITPPDSQYRRGFREVMRYLLEKEGFGGLVAAGDPNVGQDGWPGPKAAVGYGAIEADEITLYRSPEQVEGETNGNGSRSIAGLTFRLTDGTDEGTPVEWHQPVPLALAGQHLRPVLGDIEIPESWQDFIRFARGSEVPALENICAKDIRGVERPSLTRSVLVRFIENVYRPQLREARRR